MGTPSLVIATVLYCAVHSLAASNPAKSLARCWLGRSADRWYRLVFNLFSGISFLPILWLLVVIPDRTLYVLRLPWLVLTTMVQLAGAAIILVGILQTGALSFVGFRQIITKENPSASGIFVDHGLYRWVRHPLYTGGLLIIWLSPLMTQNLLILFSLLTLYLFIGARLEEKRLAADFGIRPYSQVTAICSLSF
jgi:protein-S-isoprenylcysteine O-methyltransferase Ste14